MFPGEIVLVWVPEVLLVTKTSILQRCPAVIKPPERLMEVAPVEAVSTRGGVGPQPVITEGDELLTVTPAGKLSVSEKFVRLVSPGAKKSILNRELLPAVIVEGENDFVPPTLDPATVTSAFTGTRLPTPWAVVKPPGGIVFLSRPEAVPTGAEIGTEMVHVPGDVGLPAGIVPPLKLMLVDVVVIAPPQSVVTVPFTVSGVGKLSVKLTPV